MIAKKQSDILQFPQGHCFPADLLAKHSAPVRTIEELEAIVAEHNELMGRPMATGATRTKLVSVALVAKRKAGRKAWEATGKKAAFANN